MGKHDTFESMSAEYQSRINAAFYNLSISRTEEEAETAGTEAKKVITEYVKRLKTFMQAAELQAIKDHSAILRMLNDRWNLDPDKCSVEYKIHRHIIRWTVTLIPQNEKYYYISLRGVPVNMNSFYEWCMNMLT